MRSTLLGEQRPEYPPDARYQRKKAAAASSATTGCERHRIAPHAARHRVHLLPLIHNDRPRPLLRQDPHLLQHLGHGMAVIRIGVLSLPHLLPPPSALPSPQRPYPPRPRLPTPRHHLRQVRHRQSRCAYMLQDWTDIFSSFTSFKKI